MLSSKAPKINLATLLSSPTPSADLQHSAFLATCAQFTRAIDEYVLKGREEISRRRDEHEGMLRREKERMEGMEKETVECRAKEVELLKDLEKEKSQRKELEADVVKSRKQLSNLQNTCLKFESDLDEIRSKIVKLRNEKARDKGILDAQATKNVPELKTLEESLGFSVEGVQKNILLFRFSQVDDSDPDRDFTFVLDVSSRMYKVPTSTPLLPALPALLDWLNETREFWHFIKKVRAAFREYVVEERERRGR